MTDSRARKISTTVNTTTVTQKDREPMNHFALPSICVQSCRSPAGTLLSSHVSFDCLCMTPPHLDFVVCNVLSEHLAISYPRCQEHMC